MNKTKLSVMAFSMLCVSILCASSTFAQSTDPDNPTPLTQNTFQGKFPGGDETVVYYYAFTAGPGILKITADQKSGGITAMDNLSWTLLDANFKELATEDFYGVTVSERKVKDIKLTKKGKVILTVKVTDDVQNFKFQLAGAVTFTGGEVIPEISGDNNTQSTQQICMPRNGIIIMTMQDGKKAKVDLSKVQKIEIQ